jgi:hypothetical protein
MIGQMIGLIIQVIHAIFMIALWLSPFYLRNPSWLLGGIVIQSLILAHQILLDNQCILVLLEDWLSGAKYELHQGKSLFIMTRLTADAMGQENAVILNSLIPYIFIIGACYKISTLI